MDPQASISKQLRSMSAQDDSHSQFSATGLAAAQALRQISVFLHNRTGSLRALCALLADNHIEILGISMQDTTEMTLVRLILSDPEAASLIFIERGIPHAECAVVIVEVQEEASQLQHTLDSVHRAELNIEFCYHLLARPRGMPLLALHCDDTQRCAQVLAAAGQRVLSQQELLGN